MIAAAFAYFNYKFSEYKFINFKELVFYTKNDVFKPTQEKYIVVFYIQEKIKMREIVKDKLVCVFMN